MKSQTLLKSGTNKQFDKLNEGDLVMAIQSNRVFIDKDRFKVDVNIDWSFDEEATTIEIKSMLAGFLGSIEDVFGEKMVTEVILHYAKDYDHLVITPMGAGLSFKSKGLQFKKYEKQG